MIREMKAVKKKKAEKILRKTSCIIIKPTDDEIPVAAEILSSISKANMTIAKAQKLLENLAKIIPTISHF